MDDELLFRIKLVMQQTGVDTNTMVKQIQEITNTQKQQEQQAQKLRATEAASLAERLKGKAELKSVAMQELSQDKELIESKGKLSKANIDLTKQVKEISKEMLQQEKVQRALADSGKYVDETMAKVTKGALNLKDAEMKLTENAKAVAQEIMSLKKEIEASGKATAEQVAKLKQLENALDTYKEAADSAGDAQNEFNRMMLNADDRLTTSIKSVGMLGASLAGLGGTIGNIFGDGAAQMMDFAGSAAQAANQFADLNDQIKAGKDTGGLQGQMMQASAYVGMVQMGVQMAVQMYNMIDGAIRKSEQAVIDKGKAATDTANQFKSYELGNKSIEDRIKLIDEVAKSDQKMASSLRGLAADSEAFDAKLKQVNKSLLETREKGMGKEWEVEQTGGGLFGWMKKIGTATEEMAANMGKARVAIDEFRQGVSQTGKDMEAALTAATSYTGSVDDRIRAMNISIAQNKGDIAEVRRLTIEGLDLEKEKTKELIQEKINLIKQREIESKIQASEVRRSVAGQQRLINEMTDFRDDDSTQKVMDASFKNQKDLAAFMANMRQILDTNIKYYDDEKTYIKETVAELEHTFGKQFKTAVRMADESMSEFFTNLITGDTDIKNYITSMRELLPALNEVQSGTSLYTKALKDLKDQLDPNNEKSIEKAFDRLIAKQRELWASEDAKGKEKPKVTKDIKEIGDVALTADGNLKKLMDSVKSMNLVQIETLKTDVAQQLYKLLFDNVDDLLQTERIQQYTELLTALEQAGIAVNKSLDAMGATAEQRLQGLKDKYNGILYPTGTAQETALEQQNREVDVYIDGIEKALDINGKLSDEQKSYYEQMRSDMKFYNEQIQWATELQKTLNETTEKLPEIWKRATGLGKIHVDWLQSFDAKGYKAFVDQQNKDVLSGTLGDIEKTRQDMLRRLVVNPEELRKQMKEIFDIDLTGDFSQDMKIIENYFNKLKDEATDLATKKGDIKEVVDQFKGLKDEIAGLKQTNQQWSLDFSTKDFNREFDAAMGKSTESVIDRIKRTTQQANDSLTEVDVNSKMALQKSFDEATKGLAETDEKYILEKQKLDEKLIQSDHDTAQKRLEIQKKAALEYAAAWKTEYDKLQGMQDAYNKRLADREKLTSDSRVEMSNYVRRAKMTDNERTADDQVKQLGDEYERYRKAGLSEQELQEWLALRKKELTKGDNADQLGLFEKYWRDRKTLADNAAIADQQAWDAQTQKQRDEITTQTELVDALKKLADDTKNTLLEMLGLVPKVDEKIKEIAVKPQPDSTKLINGTPPPNASTAPPGGIKPQDGALYSTVKGSLAPEYQPSSEMLSRIGTAGITDLQFVDYTKKGGYGWGWIGYRAAGTNGGQSSSAIGTGTETSKPAEFVPIETSKEIQDRIDGWKNLQTIAKEVLTNMKGWITEFDAAIEKSFEWFKPTKEKDWVKDLVNAWSNLGKEIVDKFTTPFKEAFDTAHYQSTWQHNIAKWGKELIEQYANGIRSAMSTLKEAITFVIERGILVKVETHSPPKEAPLNTIDVMGQKLGELWAQNVALGIDNGTKYIDQGLSKTVTKLANTYAPTVGGLTTAMNTSDLTALTDLRSWLLQSPDTVDQWSKRSAVYAAKDTNLSDFSKLVDLQMDKSAIDQQNAELATGTNLDKANQFYKWFNKSLINPDLGDISLDLLRSWVSEHPEMKTWYWFTEKLNQQYPEIYKDAIAAGIISPPAVDWKMENGQKIGAFQTGATNDKYSVDYKETNFAGATGFNDWLQGKFNEFLKTKTDDGKSLKYGSYDVVAQRDIFLEGWSQDRLAQLVSQYQDYVKGLGTVKSYEDLLGGIKGSGSEIAQQLQQGKSISDIIYNSKYADALLTDEQKQQYKDRQVVSGGGWYDANGNEIVGMDKLIKSYGGGGTGRQQGITQSELEYLLRTANAALGDKAGTFVNRIAGIMGKGWEWGVFKIGNGDTSIQAPYNVMKITDANAMRSAGYALYPMSESDARRIYGPDAVKQFKLEGVWPFILYSASKGNVQGDYSDLQAEANATLADLQKQILTKYGGSKRSLGSGTSGDELNGLIYKNKYTTIKGNYEAGYSQLSKLVGGMDTDTRKLMLDRITANIDEVYKDTQVPIGQGDIGMGIVEGDFTKVSGTMGKDYSNVRAAMKDQLAQALGFSKEYSVARGWRNALDADPEQVANEEILKWIELTSNEIMKQQQTQSTVEQSSNVQDAKDYLKGIIDNGGLNAQTLQEVQQGLTMALGYGFITKADAADIIQEIIPAGLIQEQIGLTSYRGGMGEIGNFSWVDAILQSPWGTEAGKYGQEGRRQFLGEYADANTMIQRQYADAYKITDNAFQYYAASSPYYGEGTPWLQPPPSSGTVPSIPVGYGGYGGSAPMPSVTYGDNYKAPFNMGSNAQFYISATFTGDISFNGTKEELLDIVLEGIQGTVANLGEDL